MQNQNTQIAPILRKVRNYEIKLRKAITGSVAGEIKSLAKGSGLEFDDVRPYQYGDDVRVIDWNVSAKGNGTYIKTFKEDKDQSLWILYDLSSSTLVNNSVRGDLIKELSSVLYLSGINQGTNVASVGFSNDLECFTKPTKTKSKGIANVTRLLKSSAKEKKTNLAHVIKKTTGLIKKKSLVFIVSDFEDANFEDELRFLANKHEVILFRVRDKEIKSNLPLGILPKQHAESGKVTFSIQSLFGSIGKNNKVSKVLEQEYQRLTSVNKIDSIDVFTNDEYINSLIIFFKKRLRKK